MIPDRGLEVIRTVVIVDPGLDLDLEVMEGTRILDLTHDLGLDHEVVHLPYLEDRDHHRS